MENSKDFEFDVKDGVIIGSKPFKVEIEYIERNLEANKAEDKKVVLKKYAYTEEEALKTLKSELEKLSKNKNVTNILGYATHKITDLKITVPNTSIGDGAFANRELTSVEFGDKISIISRNSFANNNLRSIVLPEVLGVVGHNAFENNKLVEVYIPSKVTSIDAEAFKNNRLKEVTFAPDSALTYIGEGAFAENDLTTVVLPAGVTRIKPMAFDENTEVQKLTSKHR